MRFSKLDGVITTIILGLIAACLGLGFANFKPYEHMVTSSVSLFVDDGSVASGVIIDDNVVATAGHVLKYLEQKGFKKIIVRQYCGTLVEGSDYYYDKEHDVGFIFVDMDEKSIAVFRNTPVELGDEVFLVGNPLRLEFTLTDGIISHLSKPFIIYHDLLQVSNTSGPGSSGGPLYDERGKLIGICTGFHNGITGLTAVTKVKYIKEVYEKWSRLDENKKEVR